MPRRPHLCSEQVVDEHVAAGEVMVHESSEDLLRHLRQLERSRPHTISTRRVETCVTAE